jgi:hypothetical protein
MEFIDSVGNRVIRGLNDRGLSGDLIAGGRGVFADVVITEDQSTLRYCFFYDATVEFYPYPPAGFFIRSWIIGARRWQLIRIHQGRARFAFHSLYGEENRRLLCADC